MALQELKQVGQVDRSYQGVETQSALDDGLGCLSELRPDDPGRILDVMDHGPDADEPGVFGECRQVVGGASGAHVDPAHDARNRVVPVRKFQDIPGFRDGRRGLHQHGPHDCPVRQKRRQVRGLIVPIQGLQRRLQPAVVVPLDGPVMLVGVDARHHGAHPPPGASVLEIRARHWAPPGYS